MLEKIAADMPRITPKQIRKHILSVNMGLKIAEDECRLLAEQGYRKVPSKVEIRRRLIYITNKSEVYTVLSPTVIAGEIHRWWLEGE